MSGSDPGLPSPAIGAKLFAIMDSLPQTDVELGSIVKVSARGTNGVRDPILYQQHIRPQVYIPIHETDATPIGSSLQLLRMPISRQLWRRMWPSNQRSGGWSILTILYGRWFTTPKDDRWKKSNNQQTINKFCNH